MPPPAKVVADWELRAWNAVQALRDGRYNREIGLDLILTLTLVREVVPNDATDVLVLLKRAFATLNSIKDRFDRVGKWGVTGDDLRCVEEAMVPLLGVIPQMNKSEFHAALVRVYERTGRITLE